MRIRIFYRSWLDPPSSVPLSTEKYPVARVCPKCGHAAYTQVGDSITVPFARDRKCERCGTVYAPKPRKGPAVFFFLVGLVLTVPFGASAFNTSLYLLHFRSSEYYRPDIWTVVCPGIIALVGVWMLFYSTRAFRRTARYRQPKR